MIRIGRTLPSWKILVLAACSAVAIPGRAPAQPAKSGEPPKPKVLVVSPAAEPVPALKYRLVPSSADLIPGDAAPIYLRIRHEVNDEAWRQITEKPTKWLELPMKDFPTAEARQFVDIWKNKLKQIEFGAHRKTCEWNYTLPEERLNVVAILLPDAQSMRHWTRLLAVKARVEIAERRFDDAIRTLETGMAFGRHVGRGPFLINGLVGIAIASVMLDRCDELIAQPGAPNLYWALTVLPRPLVGLRDPVELEKKLLENLIPELREDELDRPHTAAEWASFLARMHEGFVKWSRFDALGGLNDPQLQAFAAGELAGFKSRALPAAKEHLKATRKLTDPQLAAMPDDQVVALFYADGYREIWDDFFKNSYLPPRIAIPQYAASEPRRLAARRGPFTLFVQYMPSLQSVMYAELRVDRRVAALRVVEAIRLYAAAHDGGLPESLDRVTEVPVPDDPATGKPFEYHRDGNSATLSGPKAGLPPPWPSYRITIRR
ncbi:MAG: hypothetical protein ACLQGP_35605 [Isosphaeraceae bacterium]